MSVFVMFVMVKVDLINVLYVGQKLKTKKLE